MWTYTSAGVRLAQAACAAGVELAGAELAVLGEPSRRRVSRRSGVPASARSRCYGISEAGPIGFGCLDPASADEVHVFHDLNAVIAADAPAPGLTPGMLLVSSLRETAPFLLLNVSFGDAGVISNRRCGCPAGAGRLEMPPGPSPQPGEADGGRHDLPRRGRDPRPGRGPACAVRRRADRLPAPGGERCRGTSPAGRWWSTRASARWTRRRSPASCWTGSASRGSAERVMALAWQAPA